MRKRRSEEPEKVGAASSSTSKKNRIHNSAVHQEYVQSETVTPEKKTVYRSVCKHCVAPKSQSFPHKQCSELKRHLKVCHPDVHTKVEMLDNKQLEEKPLVTSVSLDRQGARPYRGRHAGSSPWKVGR